MQKKSTDFQGVLPDLLLCKWDGSCSHKHQRVINQISLFFSPPVHFPVLHSKAALLHSRSLPGCKLLRFQHIPERSASQIQSTAERRACPVCHPLTGDALGMKMLLIRASCSNTDKEKCPEARAEVKGTHGPQLLPPTPQ